MFKIILAISLLLSFSYARNFQAISPKDGEFVNKENQYYCPNCGMYLPNYYKTNHIHDGKQYSSMHCLYEQTQGKELGEVKVVDTSSLKFIDAKKAFYVLGSKKAGTMTKRSKYAFANEKDALDFIEKNSGELATFEEAYKAAGDDFEQDKKIIQTKREKIVYKSGKKLYESKCNSVDVKSFDTIASLKTSLKKSCKIRSDKQLQEVSVYLWDTIKLKKDEREIITLDVPEDANCPICGMFVAKYPEWATKLEYDGKTLYFDGVKDMMKYIFKEDIKLKDLKIVVTDYFTGKAVDGHKAYFVLGSDIYGPMGKEFVAFEDDEAAYNFKNEHFGKRVAQFTEMEELMLLYMD